MRNEATPGQIISVALAMLVGSFSLASMAPDLQAITVARGATAKLWETIDRVPSIDSTSLDGLHPQTINGHIEFEDVVFEYPSRPNVTVLKGVTLSFEAGKTTAVVGPSGSGKRSVFLHVFTNYPRLTNSSTLVSLIERFYDAVSGSIKLDGNDVKSLNLKWLRRQIGLVSQEPVLFATTILENVAHGLTGTVYETSLPEEKFRLVKMACISANADGFISKLPQGYDTMVGERGFLLSGGQKREYTYTLPCFVPISAINPNLVERIAIARAIAADPKILLLDEATSALDTQSEGAVQSALDRASTGRTTIVIAHRLSTIKDADRIYVMGSGSVLEYGTHVELLSRHGSVYAKLVEAQRLKDAQTRHTHDFSSLNELIQNEGMDNDSTGSDIQGKENFTDVKARITPLEGSHSLNPAHKEDKPGFESLLKLVRFNRESWTLYILGIACAIAAGMVYPSYGIIYGKFFQSVLRVYIQIHPFSGLSLQTFEVQDPHKLRVNMDRNALWFFITAVLAGLVGMIQNYSFSSAAAKLTENLRSLYFTTILRQESRSAISHLMRERNNERRFAVSFFDQDINNVCYF